MRHTRNRIMPLVAVPLVTGAFALLAPSVTADQHMTAGEKDRPAAAVGQEAREQRADARELVKDAATVVEQMKSDPELLALMRRAQGLLIVPDYARAAFVVGGRGGEGLLVARLDGKKWSDPVFYNLAAISVGAQAGVEAGAVAFLLMNEKSVNAFKGDSTFSLTADAGFTIIDYSALGQAAAGKGGDVIAWSDTEGLFAGATVGISDITWDDEENRAFYKAPKANPEAILSGKVRSPRATVLQRTLPPKT